MPENTPSETRRRPKRDYRANNNVDYVTTGQTSPVELIDHLSAAIFSVRDALDHGISFAETVLDDLPPDPYIYAHLIRYAACDWLGQQEASEWILDKQLAKSNSSIHIRRGKYEIRVLMSQRGETPHPGRSQARRKFYEQIPLELDIEHLILQYTVTDKQELILYLCKPIGVWVFNGLPKLAWKRKVLVQESGHVAFEHANDQLGFNFGIEGVRESEIV